MTINVVILDHAELSASEQQALLEDDVRLRNVANWRELTEAFKQCLPDALLINIHLPAVPADRAIELLLSNPQTAPIPRILVSTLPKGSPLFASAEAFADGWIQKPLSRRKIVQALQQAGVPVRPTEGPSSKAQAAISGPALTAPEPAGQPEPIAIDDFQQPVTAGALVSTAGDSSATDVLESRSSARFVAEPPIPGSFGSVGIQVVDLGEQGAQIEHGEPLKLSSSGRLLIASSYPLELRAHVVWSKLQPLTGQALYRSGLRIDEKQEVIRRGLKILVREGHARLDALSLERKRDALVERHRRRLGRTPMKPGTALPNSEELLTVRRARERLRSNPEESLKWYNRARYAVLQPENVKLLEDVAHRDEVIAVWEYLERTIPLETVIAVFKFR